MKNSVTVQEQTHSFWKTSTYLSGALCILFFLLFWNISHVFWSSIFRLSSFIFFSITVLGFLKIMDGPLTVRLSSSNNHLLVSYHKNNSKIQEEQIDRSTVQSIIPSKAQQNIINSYLQPESAALKIQFSDTERDLYLFKFGGRPLFFDRSALQDVFNFLENNNVNIHRTGSVE